MYRRISFCFQDLVCDEELEWRPASSGSVTFITTYRHHTHFKSCFGGNRGEDVKVGDCTMTFTGGLPVMLFAHFVDWGSAVLPFAFRASKCPEQSTELSRSLGAWVPGLTVMLGFLDEIQDRMLVQWLLCLHPGPLCAVVVGDRSMRGKRQAGVQHGSDSYSSSRYLTWVSCPTYLFAYIITNIESGRGGPVTTVSEQVSFGLQVKLRESG